MGAALVLKRSGLAFPERLSSSPEPAQTAFASVACSGGRAGPLLAAADSNLTGSLQCFFGGGGGRWILKEFDLCAIAGKDVQGVPFNTGFGFP